MALLTISEVARQVGLRASAVRYYEQRKILAFHAASLETGRPWLAPPGIPADRVHALRRAYDATMKDRAFLEEAKLRKFEVDPRTGEYVEAVLRRIASLPDELIAKAAQMTRRQN